MLVELVADDGERALLEGMGIVPGADVVVLRRAPFGGPLQVRVGEVTFALDRSLAALVRVDLSP